MTAWARASCPSGSPTSCTACIAATATPSAAGIGDADVLAGQDHQPPGDEARVLARLDHPGQVVQGGVDVAAAHALDQRARDVVVLVAGPVVAGRRAVHGLLDVRQGDRPPRRATGPPRPPPRAW